MRIAFAEQHRCVRTLKQIIALKNIEPSVEIYCFFHKGLMLSDGVNIPAKFLPFDVNLIKKNKIDILIPSGEPYQYINKCLQTRIPTIASFHDLASAKGKHGLVDVEKKIINDSIISIATSYRMENYLKNNYDTKKVITIRGFLPHAWIPETKNHLNEKLKIVFVGSTGRKGYKNYDPLFRQIIKNGMELFVYGGNYNIKNKLYHAFGYIPLLSVLNDLKKYDIGIIPFNLRKVKHRQNIDFSFSNKLCDYIAGGLITMINFKGSHMSNFILENKIGFISENLIINKPLSTLINYKKNVDAMKHKHTAENEMKRLVEFIKKEGYWND